jgi:hypothetical protein
MMEDKNKKISLDQAVTYEITVPGELDQSWSGWDGEMAISVSKNEAGLPVSTLTGRVDQAALQGLLRRLYGAGLPLISVKIFDRD